MKRILVLLFLIYLNNSRIGYCQLLSKPSLTVEDFEIALTNAEHLRKILKRHNFEYSSTGETKLIAPETMPNPLIPDLRAFRSEDWEPKNQRDQAVVKVSMYEWEPNYAPQPEVIKTIRVMIRQIHLMLIKQTNSLKKLKINIRIEAKDIFVILNYINQMENHLLFLPMIPKLKYEQKHFIANFTL
jgi:hypothetical protein